MNWIETITWNDEDFPFCLCAGKSAHAVVENATDIAEEIMTFGPVEATLDVYRDFFSYKSGKSLREKSTLRPVFTSSAQQQCTLTCLAKSNRDSIKTNLSQVAVEPLKPQLLKKHFRWNFEQISNWKSRRTSQVCWQTQMPCWAQTSHDIVNTNQKQV